MNEKSLLETLAGMLERGELVSPEIRTFQPSPCSSRA